VDSVHNCIALVVQVVLVVLVAYAINGAWNCIVKGVVNFTVNGV